ncbi:hypothetical protein N5C66_15930 [Rhizobium pusense]|uniref:hypothetical protein n=1 Tax=Rhizobium/Agrobacterium group TaxID=227290 RepID=UPI00115B838B|nr:MULTISPECIES: hypothetical protein [Rhizobium/Agrobacterium group]MDH0910650.1 hypothetical protein [Agrobacterium pusense]MDH1095594.1 hypothetical protein [Agrobacterium pusense]MDH1113228.1 hypothetical protein [Agrobacterium pusense]MDH2192922.1 hypothetical protein [Agrobacterium pusense]CAD7057966.1 hypothetical protein RP007_02047 [Rhizobium sp. P007]
MHNVVTTKAAVRASENGSISRRGFITLAGVALPASAVATPAPLQQRYKICLHALMDVLAEMHPDLDRHDCFKSQGEEPGSGYTLVISGSRGSSREITGRDDEHIDPPSKFAKFDSLHAEYVALYAVWNEMTDGDDGEAECWGRIVSIEQELIAFPCEDLALLRHKQDAFLNTEALWNEISRSPESLAIYFKSTSNIQGA